MAWVNVQSIDGVEISEDIGNPEHTGWTYYAEPDGTSFSTNTQAFFQGVDDDHASRNGYSCIKVVVPTAYDWTGRIRVTPTALSGGSEEINYKNWWDAVELGVWDGTDYSVTTPAIDTGIIYSGVGDTFYTGCGAGDSAPSAPDATWTIEVEVPGPDFDCSEPILELWQPPSGTYSLRIRGYAKPKAFAADTDTTTVDARLVFLLALANAKAHYSQPDAKQYFDQLQLRLRKLRARLHNDARYTMRPAWTPPRMPKIKVD